MNGFKQAMTLLIVNNGPVASEWRDHPLAGTGVGYRECHIGGEFLLIYPLDDTGNRACGVRAQRHAGGLVCLGGAGQYGRPAARSKS